MIRIYKEEDMKEIVLLFTQVFSEEPWNEKWDIEVAYKRLKMIVDTPRFIGLVIEEEEKIIGALLGNLEHWNDGDRMNIKEFFIGKNDQGKQWGKQMMNSLEKYLENDQIKHLELMTMNTDRTIKFYEKQGYKINEDLVYMYKNTK